MFKKQSDIWDYLSVEVAVKLRELLNGEDDDTAVYEYMGEAQEIIAQCKKAIQSLPLEKIEAEIVEVLNNSLEHTYELDAFEDVAQFIIDRVEIFKKQNIT